jgi:hypothetical protein
MIDDCPEHSTEDGVYNNIRGIEESLKDMSTLSVQRPDVPEGKKIDHYCPKG